MSAVLVAVIFGWSLHRAVRSSDAWPGPVTGTVLWAIVGSAGWLSLLALFGIEWRPWLVPLPLVVAVALTLHRRSVVASSRPHIDGWLLLTVGAVAPRVLAVALTPAYGWDFRYLWGLKAEAFAAAGGIDLTWLSWRPLARLHPSYPPLWPELLAAGRLLGADLATTAAAWSALLAVGLAAAGWDLARGLSRPWRTVTAVSMAWTPVLFRPEYSGYAEPLLAFLLTLALGSLALASRADSAALVTLAVAAPVLALTKNEGVVLALGCVAAALARWRLRALPAMIATLATVALWRLVVVLNDLPHPGAVTNPEALAARAATLPAAIAAALTPTLAWLFVAWLLLVPTLLDRGMRTPAAVLLLWMASVVTAYLTTPWGLAWHLTWSVDRVAAVAFPAALAVALPTALRLRAAPPAPDSAPGG